MSYSIAEEFLLDASKKAVADVFDVERSRPVVCTLRPAGRGNTDVRKQVDGRVTVVVVVVVVVVSPRSPTPPEEGKGTTGTRAPLPRTQPLPVLAVTAPPSLSLSPISQVLDWVKEAVKTWDLKGSATGEVDHGGRRVIQNQNYLQTMREARVVVTANPTGWEGDSRTWEALASGALVMVDTLECPLPFPLLDGVHVVYYDPTDKVARAAAALFFLSPFLSAPRPRSTGVVGSLHQAPSSSPPGAFMLFFACRPPRRAARRRRPFCASSSTTWTTPTRRGASGCRATCTR